MTLKPLSFYVTLEKPIVQQQTGVILHGDSKTSDATFMHAKVIDVGPEVLDIKPGDYVFFCRGLVDVMAAMFDGKPQHYCQRAAILGVIHKSPEEIELESKVITLN